MKEIIICGFIIEYNEEIIRIVDSYLISQDGIMELILKEFIKRTGYKSKRSMKSWIKEWKAHNRLYNLGLFKSHTKDCDLEENEKWWRLLVYQFLGR